MSERSERIGIVLTAGVRRKNRLNTTVFEPDPEGKVRCLAALTDLVNDQIDNIYVSGGMLDRGEPFSAAYVPYIQRQSQRYNFDQERVVRLPGKFNTSTDLQQAVRLIGKVRLNQSRIYTTSDHLERAIPRLETLGVKNADGQKAEDITRQRSKKHPKIVDQIVQLAIESRRSHEFWGKLPVIIDKIPIVGRFLFGLKLEELKAARQRKGEL